MPRRKDRTQALCFYSCRETETEGLDDGVAGEDWSQENLDELVLMDVPCEGGTVGKVVYRNGGVVDAVALEDLCDKASRIGTFFFVLYFRYDTQSRTGVCLSPGSICPPPFSKFLFHNVTTSLAGGLA